MRFALFLAVSAAWLGGANSALAGTIDYYTGSDFTSGMPPYEPSYSISGWISFSSPLPASSSGYLDAATGWSFSDGVETFTSSNSIISSSSYSTDATGNIDAWYLNISSSISDVEFVISNSNPTGDEVDNFVTSVYYASNSTAGSWSLTAPVITPEPSSMVLVGIGALALGGKLIRRRNRSSETAPPLG